MKTLHTYLTREVLQTLLMTVAVFTGILLLGSVLKDIMEMLLNHQASFGLLVKAILLMIPYVIAFSLPMGLLAATLLVFGRFSADQELTAVRANGVSIVSLCTPILLLSIALCALSAWINMNLAPTCRVAFKQLKNQVGLENPSGLLPEDQYKDNFRSGDTNSHSSYTIYVKKKDNDLLSDVIIYQFNTNAVLETTVRAEQGKIRLDAVGDDPKAKKGIFFDLTNGQLLQMGEDKQWHPWSFSSFTVGPIELKSSDDANREPEISEMSFQQLLAKRRELERKGIDATPVKFHLHRQVAFSFACIGFTLIGIPLGIRAHRRETTIGILIAGVLVLVYYSFIILGQALMTKPQYLPYLLVWVPNFIFQGVGSILLLRANRGT